MAPGAEVAVSAAAPVAAPVAAPAAAPAAAVAAACEKPVLSRAGSGPFYFQHAFARENPGELSDFYELHSALGSGAYGTAHLVTCRETGAKRAVKSILLDKVRNPQRFQAEISIARELDHPNVVRLYEIFWEPQSLHLVMQVCTGGELFEYIVRSASKGFGEAQGLTYVRQILAALSYLHANCFAHRDVKPENFLLESAEPGAALKLIDFGMARKFERGVPMSTKGGTPYYVAPEVFLGRYNERVDIWSAGVVAYIMFCGYPPFNADSDREVIRKVRKGRFHFISPDWDHVSEEAKRLVSDLLTVDAAKRPSAVAAMCAAPLHRQGGGGAAVSSDGAVLVGGNFVEKLQAFHAHTRLKRVALTAAVRQLSDAKLGPLREAFRRLDLDGDGQLSPSEVFQALQSQKEPLGMGVEVLEDILKSVDSDGSGRLDYTEFLAATVELGLVAQRDICKAAFRTFDLDGDGRITSEELREVLSSGCDPDRSPSAGRVERMVKEADLNGDGCIDFEEFFAVMATPSPQRRRRSRPADAAGGDADEIAPKALFIGDGGEGEVPSAELVGKSSKGIPGEKDCMVSCGSGSTSIGSSRSWESFSAQ
mmetsp:Transcript_64205/g.184449  ORF Transcript_64205/g.184449 Transcript_64205/m.184449 type:complete len:595 (-) Transcript_64205:91-1875(-)